MSTSRTETETANVVVPVTATVQGTETVIPEVSEAVALEATEATETTPAPAVAVPEATEAVAPETTTTTAPEPAETKPKVRRIIDEEGGKTTASVRSRNLCLKRD